MMLRFGGEACAHLERKRTTTSPGTPRAFAVEGLFLH